MKECIKVKRLLSSYLDKETNITDTTIARLHLESCSFCKEELLRFSQVKDSILKKKRRALPEDYMLCRLQVELINEQLREKKISWLANMGNLSRRLIPVPVTVIVLSLIFLILSSMQQTSRYPLEEHILSGTQTTTETALGVILGAQN